MKILITPHTNPQGKIADAALEFEAGEPLAGLRLIGFGIWRASRPAGEPVITFPARNYTVCGESRTFAIVRPAGTGGPTAADAIRAAILDAYRAALEAGEIVTE